MSSPLRPSKTPVVTGILFVLIGLALTGGGAWLIALGGSLFYAIAGLGIALTGALLIARRSGCMPSSWSAPCCGRSAISASTGGRWPRAWT